MENRYMNEAINEVKINKENNFKIGGPFGAVVVKNNKIIAKAHNTVLYSNDPTAHAEINAIRKACKTLNTHDLTNCILYTTCYPCPMCLSAIMWANIKIVYYGNTKEDAKKIGFRDDDIYKELEKPTSLKLIQINKEKTIKDFEKFKNNKNLY